MRHALLVLAFALAGCFDFARFDHLPDATSVEDLPMVDIAAVDFAGEDLAGDVLVLEPFDTTSDLTLWSTLGSPASIFTIDHETFIEGTGSLAIDVQSASSSGGQLMWIGTLPSTNGSRHLRFYARYDGVLDTNVDLASQKSTGPVNGGDNVTLSPQSNPSEGAQVVNNQYPSFFARSGVTVKPDDWHCYELGIDLIPGETKWESSLSIDGAQPAASTFVSDLPAQVVYLALGMGFPLTPPKSVKTAWIDAVELRADSVPIGCPY